MVMSKRNSELLKKVNSGIAKIKQNGKLAEIEKKWLSIRWRIIKRKLWNWQPTHQNAIKV